MLVRVAAISSLLIGSAAVAFSASPKPLRLVTLDPGHFHAALIHREGYPGVENRVTVFAPLGQDLLDHMKRVSRFNQRADKPTAWTMDVRAGDDFLARFKRERGGDVAVISGRNRGKIDYVAAAIESGMHALVDKPWVLTSADLPKVEAALAQAEKKGRVAYDMMTERFEITAILQKELVQDPAVFGTVVSGDAANPGVYMESVHHLMKVVSGAPNIRPAWFFDTQQQGEGANDIGTHLVDLVPWTLWPAPQQALDVKKDVQVLSGQRWPTVISLPQFQRVTGEKEFPAFLKPALKNDSLDYFCNTLIGYTLRGVHVKLNIIWDWEAPAGSGDTHFAYYRGTKAKIEVRQGKAEKFRSELYVVPADTTQLQSILTAVNARLSQLSVKGVVASVRGNEITLTLPDALRTTHEEHFAQVARTFFGYVKNPKSYPKWERAHMMAKYFVTTTSTELARTSPIQAAPRLAPR